MDKQLDAIKAARDVTALKAVYQDIADANTDHFNVELAPEAMLRTLITLTAEVKRLSDAVADLKAAAAAPATKSVF